MKKHSLTRAFCALAALAAILASAACGGGTGTSPTPTTPEPPVSAAPEASVTPEDTVPTENAEPAPGVDSLLQEILDTAGTGLEGEDALPMSFIDPVTAENCSKLGLTEADFALVEQAYTAVAGIISQAHEVALLYAPGHVPDVKGSIAEGYDSGKWLCVTPEKSAVTSSGDYILLTASRAATADALTEAFAEVIGPGETDVFYTSN
ncbi:MAG: hypothetical protein LBD49_05795 [Oscillospiraceae bacterium]|jgi:hypothetical protein|nr:hypothetical protein [Oscillospiraceae bacterium]